MRTTRSIIPPLAALLSAAILAGPAAAVPADGTRITSTPRYAPTSPTQGSRSDGHDTRSPNAKDATNAKAHGPELSAGRATTPAGAAPTNLRAIGEPTPVVNAGSAGFDWGSAGIGAAAAIGAFAIAIAGAAGIRGRRPARPRSVGTH